MVNNNGEINIKTYKYSLFGNDFFLVIKENQVESFDFFLGLLNNRIDIEEAKKLFVERYMVSVKDRRIIGYDYNFIIKNFMGIKDTMDRIEELYRISLRDNKIDEITKND